MGWNDHNPELYEALTGKHYGTGRPLDEPVERAPMPRGWVPPSLMRTCGGCSHTGDVVHEDFYEGTCHECGEDCCSECGSAEGDYDGTTYTCKTCLEGWDE